MGEFSWRDIVRALLQRIEAIPAFGLVLAVSAKRRRIAFRDALVTVTFGAIAVWLPLVLKYGIDADATFNKSLANTILRGDAFILVPSMVAPLYLLLGALKASSGLGVTSRVDCLITCCVWSSVSRMGAQLS